MAFGLAVDTTNGLMNLLDIRAMRAVHRRAVAGVSGSFVLSFDPPLPAIGFARPSDGRNPPQVTVAGRTVSWGQSSSLYEGSPSEAMTIIIFGIV